MQTSGKFNFADAICNLFFGSCGMIKLKKCLNLQEVNRILVYKTIKSLFLINFKLFVLICFFFIGLLYLCEMMFYRRKILLALLETFGGELGKIELQKLLFLFCHSQTNPSYDFLPYHYGCYSYQAVWDLQSLQKLNIVSEEDTKWVLQKKNNYSSILEIKDKGHLNFLVRNYNNCSADELMKLTYVRFPYYAINSRKAKMLLNPEELKKIEEQVPHNEKTILYTLGYEGISLEKYFNKLIINNVKVLCDVRRNPLSQKVGFSKSTLQKVCNALGILYVHIPELGIESEKRQNLKTQRDYDLLFTDYEQNQLKNKSSYVEQIYELLLENNRIALTCFESSHCQCHRSKVAKAITQLPNWNYELKHL